MVFIGVRDEAHLAEVRAQPSIAEIVSHPETEGGLLATSSRPCAAQLDSTLRI